MASQKKTYKIIFRIRRRYYDKIVVGEKTDEKRRNSAYWLKVIKQLNAFLTRTQGVKGWLDEQALLPFGKTEVDGCGIQAVFICGKGNKHTREVTDIERIRTPTESFSEQGKKDVDTPLCYVFHLGAEVKPDASQP